MTSTPTDVLNSLFADLANSTPTTMTSETGQMIWDYATASGDVALGEAVIRNLDEVPDTLRATWAQTCTPLQQRAAYLLRRDTPTETLVDVVRDEQNVDITRTLAGHVHRHVHVTNVLAEFCNDLTTLAVLVAHGGLLHDHDPDAVISNEARIRVYERLVAYGDGESGDRYQWRSRLHDLDPAGLDRILTNPAVTTARKVNIYTRLQPSMIADRVGADIAVARSIVESFDSTVDNDDKYSFLKAVQALPDVTREHARLVLDVAGTLPTTGKFRGLGVRAEAILSTNTGDPAEAARAVSTTDVAELVAMTEQQVLGAPNGNCVTEALAANPAVPVSFAAKHLVGLHPRAAASAHATSRATTAGILVAKALMADPPLADDTELWTRVAEPVAVLKALLALGIDYPRDKVFAGAARTLCALGRLDEIAEVLTLERVQRGSNPLVEPVVNAIAARAGDVTSLLAVTAALNNRHIDDTTTVADILAVLDLVAD